MNAHSDEAAPPPAPLRERLLKTLMCVAAWALAAVISTGHGQLLAAYHGKSQSWWPALGYTLSIFSIWALLTPAILKFARHLLWGRQGILAAIGLAIAGFLGTLIVHAVIFAALYWPLYGHQQATPLEMVRPVFLANLDKSVFAYIGLVAVSRFRSGLRASAPREDVAAEAAQGDGDEGIWIRIPGGAQFIPYDEIDWIAAAGDYTELHVAGSTRLADASLARLSAELPPAKFARIHRATIVRLDRVREIRSLGRGDAVVLLASGETLRLSRRYRHMIAASLPIRARSAT